jgi:hypothetical protein
MTERVQLEDLINDENTEYQYKQGDPTYGFDPVAEQDQIHDYRVISSFFGPRHMQVLLKVGATEIYAHEHNMKSLDVLDLFIKHNVYDKIDAKFPNPKGIGVMESFRFAETVIANEKD